MQAFYMRVCARLWMCVYICVCVRACVCACAYVHRPIHNRHSLLRISGELDKH
uniref:Uncharacterized protein n=1 Tax=Anguilla anguilla TaxID=7936 RepID=A0A0E9S4J0_ANGAN